MNRQQLESIINEIVDEGERVKKKYLEEETGPVDYVGIFSKDENEKNDMLSLMKTEGEFIQDTPTGPHYKLKRPVLTKSGPVVVIKVRTTDPKKPYRGSPDFLVDDYVSFKKKYLGRKDFNLIDREAFKMVEIWDPQADALVYFKNKPIAQILSIKTDN